MRTFHLFLLFGFSCFLTCIPMLAQKSDKMVIIDDNPKHFPMFTVSYGIGVGSVPHFPINVINHAEFLFNYQNLTFLDFKFEKLNKLSDRDFRENEVSTSSDNPIKTFQNFDLTWSISLFGKNVKRDVAIFNHQENMGIYLRTLYYDMVPSQIHRHLNLDLGVLRYRDVIGIEENEFVTQNGYILDDTHLNVSSNAIQVGLSYNKEEYVRVLAGGRKMQKIRSKRLCLELLYSPDVNIEPVYYESRGTYEIDKDRSGMIIRNYGFKAGFYIMQTIYGSTPALTYGLEVTSCPCINGYPDAIWNLSARAYACSLLIS